MKTEYYLNNRGSIAKVEKIYLLNETGKEIPAFRLSLFDKRATLTSAKVFVIRTDAIQALIDMNFTRA